MEIEMVDTIMGRVPLVALEVERTVVAENDDQRTVQITYRADGAIVRQDGLVEVKRWPEGLNLRLGVPSAQAGG